MRHLNPLEPGVMFWAGRDHVSEIKSLGVRCGQLGIPGAMDITVHDADDWKAALDEEEFTLVTVFAAFNGESYADIPSVRRTVGLLPESTREERLERTREVCDFAALLGVRSVACHVGVIPEDPEHPDHVAVRDAVRTICDHAARHLQTFALETGQESAQVLQSFLDEVDRPNVAVNFDPANMILYGVGHPIDALRVLARRVVSVHCKDGDWPNANHTGALGEERALGKGAVDVEKFVRTLREIGFRGPLNIERESPDQAERLRDIRDAVSLLKSLT